MAQSDTARKKAAQEILDEAQLRLRALARMRAKIIAAFRRQVTDTTLEEQRRSINEL